MKLQGYRETFYIYSGKVSEITRQLAFAGIALIWLFKKESAGQFSVPRELIMPGALIVAALALDLVHYIIGSVVWFVFYREQEKIGRSEEKEIDHSAWLELPIWIPFFLKTACVLTAYAMMLQYLLRAIAFI